MGETSQVTLNWESHERALKDGIWNFFQSCFMLDTKLRCRTKEFRAHKLILSLFSSVLKTKLEEEGDKMILEKRSTQQRRKTGSADDRDRDVVFIDLSEMVEQRNDFELLVKFLYTGKVTLQRNRIQSLRNLAEKLDVQSLITVIADEAKETEEKEQTQKKVTQKVVEEETSDDDDYISNDDDDYKDDSVFEESGKETERQNTEKMEPIMTRTRSSRLSKRDEIDCEREDIFTWDEDSEESTLATKRRKKAKTKKKDAKTSRHKSYLLNLEEKDYIFRPFDDDDEFEREEDIKTIRKLIEKQKERKASSKYVDTNVNFKSNTTEVNGKEEEERFNFDESDDYEERGEVYEWEKKRMFLPPRITKTRSVRAKFHFIKDRQTFRERVPFMYCEVCNYKTRYRDLIKRHVRNRHVYTPKTQIHRCETCGKFFRLKDMYDLHQRTHENPGGVEELKCPRCDYKTSKLFSLKTHLACKHKVDVDGNQLEERIVCSQCEYKCVHPEQLREHVKRKHFNKPMHVCDECGFKSRGRAHLQLHIDSVHREERNFMCEICGYSSKTKGALTQHKSIHNNERKYVCETCGMKFNRSAYLTNHMSVHDPDHKPYVCDVCGHKTNKKFSLKKHMMRHLPDRVDKRKGRKIGMRRCGNRSRTIDKESVATTPSTDTNVDTSLLAQSSNSNSSSCAGPSVVPQPNLDVHSQPYVTANQSQPTIYNNNYSYQHNYGMWMCNF